MISPEPLKKLNKKTRQKDLGSVTFMDLEETPNGEKTKEFKTCRTFPNKELLFFLIFH